MSEGSDLRIVIENVSLPKADGTPLIGLVATMIAEVLP
jgi:hypothetical protein